MLITSHLTTLQVVYGYLMGKGIREFRKAVKDVQEEITLPEGESSSLDPKAPENQVVRQGTESDKSKTQN